MYTAKYIVWQEFATACLKGHVLVEWWFSAAETVTNSRKVFVLLKDQYMYLPTRPVSKGGGGVSPIGAVPASAEGGHPGGGGTDHCTT